VVDFPNIKTVIEIIKEKKLTPKQVENSVLNWLFSVHFGVLIALSI
jgi:hypothetical protein